MTLLNVRSANDPGYRKITLSLTVNNREADNLAGFLDEWGWEDEAEAMREVADACYIEEQTYDQGGP